MWHTFLDFVGCLGATSPAPAAILHRCIKIHQCSHIPSQILSLPPSLFLFLSLSSSLPLPFYRRTQSNTPAFPTPSLAVLTRLLTSRRNQPVLFAVNMVDFVSILPFYITKLIEISGEANAGSFSFLRVIRLARVFRLLKLSKYSEGLQLLGNTLARSMPALGMLMAFESIYIIILSTAVYMVERGQYCDEVCPGDCDGYCFGTATKGSGWYAVVSGPYTPT
jgi:hypothetical protein